MVAFNTIVEQKFTFVHVKRYSYSTNQEKNAKRVDDINYLLTTSGFKCYKPEAD